MPHSSGHGRPIMATPNFTEWVKMSLAWLSIPIFGLAWAVCAEAIIRLIPKALAWPWIFPCLFGFQALYVALLYSVVPAPVTDRSLASRASRAAEQFVQAWKRVWLFWILLYAAFAAISSWEVSRIAANEPTTGWLPWDLAMAAENLLSNLVTAALIMCYIVVSRKTVDLGDSRESLPWKYALLAVMVIAAAEVLARLGVSAGVGQWLGGLPSVVKWITALASGLTLALFVGRLDSKLIRPPVVVVTLLYLYAVMQTGWIKFEESRATMALLTNAALFLKTLLFVFVAWLLRSGILLFYLDRVAKIYEGVHTERAAFLHELEAPDRQGANSARSTESTGELDK